MNMMLVWLLFWARTQYPNGANVLIITKNENLLDQHKVWNIIDGLEQRDFYFAIEHPDTFIPAACAESSHACDNCMVPTSMRKRKADGDYKKWLNEGINGRGDSLPEGVALKN